MNNTGIPQWVFQGIYLTSSWFIGDILQPAKIPQYIKQTSVRQQVIRKTYTWKRKNKKAGGDTCTTRTVIPQCFYKGTERESWNRGLSRKGERRVCRSSVSLICRSSLPAVQVHPRIWGNEEEAGLEGLHLPLHFLSVDPCLEKEATISQIFIDVIENNFLRWETKGSIHSPWSLHRETTFTLCVGGSEFLDLSCFKKSHQFIKNTGLKQIQEVLFIQRQHRKWKKLATQITSNPKHSESVLNWRSAISWDLPTGFWDILLIISK